MTMEQEFEKWYATTYGAPMWRDKVIGDHGLTLRDALLETWCASFIQAHVVAAQEVRALKRQLEQYEEDALDHLVALEKMEMRDD